MPELLGRREISLPQTGVKTNELIEKHVFYADSGPCKSTPELPVRRYVRRRDFITKIRTIFSVYENNFESPWLCGNLFHFRNNKTEDTLVYKSNPAGVKLI